MNDIQPVTHGRHGSLRWLRYSNYLFASQTSLVPLASGEVFKAALSMPLAFTNYGEKISLSAVLGLLPGQNFYVPTSGRWVTDYVPAFFRTYPFRLGWATPSEAVLCIDEGSGLLTNGPEGEEFFTDTGEPSAAISNAWSFLQEVARSEVELSAICRVLHATDVIEPWRIEVEVAGATQSIEGLYKINETILNNIDSEKFGELRKVGALGVAYAQILSMGHLPNLVKLGQARAESEAAERARAEVKPMMTLPDDSTIDWDWSKVGKT